MGISIKEKPLLLKAGESGLPFEHPNWLDDITLRIYNNVMSAVEDVNKMDVETMGVPYAESGKGEKILVVSLTETFYECCADEFIQAVMADYWKQFGEDIPEWLVTDDVTPEEIEECPIRAYEGIASEEILSDVSLWDQYVTLLCLMEICTHDDNTDTFICNPQTKLFLTEADEAVTVFDEDGRLKVVDVHSGQSGEFYTQTYDYKRYKFASPTQLIGPL